MTDFQLMQKIALSSELGEKCTHVALPSQDKPAPAQQYIASLSQMSTFWTLPVRCAALRTQIQYFKKRGAYMKNSKSDHSKTF